VLNVKIKTLFIYFTLFEATFSSLFLFFFINKNSHLKFDAGNTFEMKFGQRLVFHRVASPFVLTLCMCLRADKANCRSFQGDMFSHS